MQARLASQVPREAVSVHIHRLRQVFQIETALKESSLDACWWCAPFPLQLCQLWEGFQIHISPQGSHLEHPHEAKTLRMRLLQELVFPKLLPQVPHKVYPQLARDSWRLFEWPGPSTTQNIVRSVTKAGRIILKPRYHDEKKCEERARTCEM